MPAEEDLIVQVSQLASLLPIVSSPPGSMMSVANGNIYNDLVTVKKLLLRISA